MPHIFTPFQTEFRDQTTKNKKKTMYNSNMKKTIPVQVSFTPNTLTRVINYAKNVDCVSITGNPKAATAVTKTMRVVLGFFSDDDFQECLENEGIDALAFIQRCVKKGMKESLGKK